MINSIQAQNVVPTNTIGPVDSYGFLSGPDGKQWTYTTSFTQKYGFYTSMTVEVYNAEHLLVGKIVDSLNIADPNVTGVRDVQVTGFVTKKFFNFDNNYELMLFVVANTKQYVNKYFNRIYSIVEGEISTQPVCEMPGNMVASKNIGEEYSENYTVVFKRDSTNATGMQYFDVYTKASYASPDAPELKHTFEIPYANLAALNDLFPIFMVKNGAYINYFTTQYEKPYFVPGTPVYEDPVVNENNSLVITQYDNKFNIIGETKIPMAKDPDEAYLYTFYSLGSLSGERDILLDYNGTGKPAFVITEDNYAIASDGSVYSYRLYDNEGNLLNTIAEYALGTIHMSDVAGYERQYGFLKNENDVEFIQMVDVPSCKTVARIPLYNGGATLSGNWDRVAQGESYQYVVSLLQGENAEDGTIHQRIAWFTDKGKLDHYDDLNLGKRVETAQVNIQAAILNPRLFNADNAREYMVLLKRTKAGSSDKEEVLLICNNEGETLLELGSDAAKGGALSMINVLNETTNPVLLCAYNNDSQFTLNFHALPLSKNTLQGDGTAANPYQITCAADFIQIDDQPMAYYQIMNDIDFGGAAFGGLQKTFGGKLDGGDKQLTNLYLNGSGLFREVVDTAVIKNIRLIEPVMALNSNGLYAGLVANTMRGGFADGVADEGGTLHGLSAILHNVHVVAPTIVGTNFAGVCGGLIGEASLFVEMSECSVQDANIDLPHAEALGGLVGHMMTSSSMNVAAFSGTLIGGATVGGIAASVDGDSPIKHAHVNAAIEGATIVGGIVGSSERATIANNYVEGALSLDLATDKGGVGGIVGALAADIMGKATDAIVHDNIVALQAIQAPQAAIAHRVVGFSSCNDYEYDWDKVDWNKDQSEWPRIYGSTEKCLKDNYVTSALALLDATIAADNTTTEGADMAANELTTEWLNAHGFVLGNSIDAPWVLNEGVLYLWFEEGRTNTGIEDIWTDNTTSTARKMLIDGQVVIIRDGQMYSVLGVRM